MSCPHPKQRTSTLCAACKAAERQRLAAAALRARRAALAPPRSAGTQAAIDLALATTGMERDRYRLALLRGRAQDWGLT